MIYVVLHIFFYIVFVLLAIFILYLLLLSVAGLFYKQKKYAIVGLKKNIAVLITSYRDDEVIATSVQQAVDHDYPEENFDVFVVADHLQSSTINLLRQSGAHIYEVNFERGSKARSLNFLLNKIDSEKYEIALVLDGDNILVKGCLEKINAAFETDNIVFQAHRTAKNLDTPVAILDALSEEVNNHLFRKAPSVLGLSSSLIGSGMAFPFALLKKVYNKPGILDNPACDREADFEVLKTGNKIIYAENATVLDEKVASKSVYENQRRRWIESQLMHIGLFFKEKVPNKTGDYWHKLFTNLIPPRILFLLVFGSIAVLFVVQYFMHVNIAGIAWQYWLLLALCYCLVILLAIPTKFYNLKTLKAILFLPVLLMSFTRAALTVKRNRKEFIHTPKSYTDDPADTKKLR